MAPNILLPVSIAEPGRTTTMAYNKRGNLLQKTIAANSLSRNWTYTYNTVGQVLTATGPLGDVTGYSYDAQGNLSTITNAMGHVTTLSNYDANGHVGRVVAPNGLVTTMTYSPRGWLLSRDVGGEVTTFTYDQVGQMTSVRAPNGALVSYTYNDQRRGSVPDGLGSGSRLQLGVMGNGCQSIAD